MNEGENAGRDQILRTESITFAIKFWEGTLTARQVLVRNWCLHRLAAGAAAGQVSRGMRLPFYLLSCISTLIVPDQEAAALAPLPRLEALPHLINPLVSLPQLLSSFSSLMHSLLPIISYNASPTTLGIYTILCGLFLYTASKMFGFGSRNQFVVAGRVWTRCLHLHRRCY